MWAEGVKNFAHFPTFLFDYTFNTNKHGLLLGSIGPCGLHLAGTSHLPCVRFIPAIFCISTKEDEEAHSILMKMFEEWRATAPVQPPPLTDAYLDWACLTSAAKYFGDRHVYLHRDLQHVKTDIRKEARVKDPVSGMIRLRRAELLPVIIEFVEFAAILPSDLEFHTFMDSVLNRM
eukprot:12398679-Karenia_brevis.AAC.1